MSKFDVYTPAARAQMQRAKAENAIAIVEALFQRDRGQSALLAQSMQRFVAAILATGGTLRLSRDTLDAALKHRPRVEYDPGTNEEIWTMTEEKSDA